MKISMVGKIFQRLKFISSIEISMLEIRPSFEIFFPTTEIFIVFIIGKIRSIYTLYKKIVDYGTKAFTLCSKFSEKLHKETLYSIMLGNALVLQYSKILVLSAESCTS